MPNSGPPASIRAALLDHLFRNVELASPEDVFLALFTTAPDAAGEGGTEVNADGYSRQPLGFAPAESVTGSITTSSDVEFDPAEEDWGTIVAIGIYDDVTAGDLLAYGPLGQSRVVLEGDVISFPSGNVTVFLAAETE